MAKKRKRRKQSKQWKAVEREVAVFFGSRRNPLSGENSGHKTNSDSLHPSLYIETKRRIQHAACALYQKELPKAVKEGKPLILALKSHRQNGFLIVIDPNDLERIAEVVRHQRSSTSWPKMKMLRPSTEGVRQRPRLHRQ